MSRHRFLKNMTDDDYEDFQNDDEEDYDEEVYEVFDTLIDSIPDISYDEIESALVDFGYNVEDTINYFLESIEDQPKQPPPPKLSKQSPPPPSTQTKKDNKQSLAQNINIVNNNLKNLNIQQQQQQQQQQKTNTNDSRTPYNTPTGTPINNNNIPNSPIDRIDPSKILSTPPLESVNLNKNIKQHNQTRKKELEEMVHKEFVTTENKPHLNMVVIGHVDAGKSTTMGHLLYKLGFVDKRTMDRFQRESEKLGKSTFHFAWVLDEQDEERERGVTMDVCVRYFETEHRRITLLDAPGHRDFIPNMISGTTQADVAVLIVNANEFEAGFSSEGQTKEHALLAKSLGIMQLIVAVNKMDLVDWSEERYNFIVDSLKSFLSSAKFNEKNIRFIPVSGYTGDNLVDRSPQLDSKLSWYQGPTLANQIDSFSIGERLINKPFRMIVNDIFKSSSKGSVWVGGKIEAGVVGIGDKLLVSPGSEICTVKNIRRQQLDSEWAVGGDNIEIGLVFDSNIIRVGCILSDPEKPIHVSRKFIAQIVTFVVPIPMTNGYDAVFHAHSLEEPATITKLISILDEKGNVAKKNPRCISSTTTAVVEITLPRPACLELYSSYRQLGRFTLRELGKTIAAGLITQFLDPQD
eukprot:gene2607-3232_t